MLRRIHKRMPKQLASDERERERESQPQVSQNQYNTTKKKKKKIHYSLSTPQTKPIKVLVGYRVLHGTATSHQTNLTVDESMKVEV